MELEQIHKEANIVKKKALLDMCARAHKLHEHIIKKHIRDDIIYNIIHKQEKEDHATYPDNISKNWFDQDVQYRISDSSSHVIALSIEYGLYSTISHIVRFIFF